MSTFPPPQWHKQASIPAKPVNTFNMFMYARQTESSELTCKYFFGDERLREGLNAETEPERESVWSFYTF